MATETPPTDPILPTPRRRWVRRVAIAVLLLILLPVAALGVAAMLLPTDLIARSAASRADAALGVPVAIGDLEIDFWPIPSVSLLDARLGSDAAPMARVDRILLRPRLLPLLRGEVTVREIAIDRPDIRLAVDSAGVLNLPFGGDDGADGTETSAANIEFAVDELRIRDGRLSYADARDSTLVVLNGLQQALRIEGAVEEGSLSRVGLSGRISSDSVDASLPGRLGAPLRGVNFAIEHDAELDRAADRIRLDSVRIELQRIALSGSGVLASVSDSLRRSVDLDLRADEFSFEDLARSLPEGFLAELLAGRRDAGADSAAAPETAAAEAMEYAGRAAIAIPVVTVAAAGAGRARSCARPG